MMIGTSEIPDRGQRPVRRSQRASARRRLCGENDRGHRAVDSVSFKVRPVKLSGIAGVSARPARAREVLPDNENTPEEASSCTAKLQPTVPRCFATMVSCLPKSLRNACVPD